MGGKMKLFLCDAHLEYARPHLEAAAALVDECGYHRRDREVAELRQQIG